MCELKTSSDDSEQAHTSTTGWTKRDWIALSNQTPAFSTDGCIHACVASIDRNSPSPGTRMLLFEGFLLVSPHRQSVLRNKLLPQFLGLFVILQSRPQSTQLGYAAGRDKKPGIQGEHRNLSTVREPKKGFRVSCLIAVIPWLLNTSFPLFLKFGDMTDSPMLLKMDAVWEVLMPRDALMSGGICSSLASSFICVGFRI